MIVKHVVEKADGSVVFQGVLQDKELAYVIETGLDVLIQAGHIPFVSTEDYNQADLHMGNETEN